MVRKLLEYTKLKFIYHISFILSFNKQNCYWTTESIFQTLHNITRISSYIKGHAALLNMVVKVATCKAFVNYSLKYMCLIFILQRLQPRWFWQFHSVNMFSIQCSLIAGKNALQVFLKLRVLQLKDI